MDKIELAGREPLHERGPTSDQRRWLDFESGFLEVAFGMGYEQRRCVRNRQIADAHHLVVRRPRAIGS